MYFAAALQGTSASRLHANDDAGGLASPTLAAFTALCRGDAALAGLVRLIAATLERERLGTEH